MNPGGSAHLGGPTATRANSAFVDGVHVALLAAAGAPVLAAASVVTLLPRRDAPVPADEETEPAGPDALPDQPSGLPPELEALRDFHLPPGCLR